MKIPGSPFVGCAALCLALVVARPASAAETGLPSAPAPQQSSSAQPAPAAQTPASTSVPAPTTSPAAAGSAQNGQATPPASDDQLKQEEKQRLLGIVPAFNTVEGGAAAPLRPSEKINLWFHSAIDPFTFAIAGIDAGIGQAENSDPGYHQGFVGFAKRYGADYTDNVDGNFWGNAILPIVLHQDPRYFRLGHGSAKRRIGYVLLSTVRCRSDKGQWQPSYSNIGGNIIGGAISNLYVPAAERGVSQVFESALTVTAEGAIGAFAFEFYPDALTWLRKHRHHGAPAHP